MDKDKILEALWDCPYCGKKGIGGLTKECPGCGSPQGKNVQFYLGDEDRVLDEEKAEKYGKGADWICPYCQTLNNVHNDKCKHCGAEHKEATEDYFKREQTGEDIDKENAKKAAAKKSSPILPVILAVIVLAIIFSIIPKSSKFTVTEKTWSRDIYIEQYQTLQKNDWEVPDGGRVTKEETAIHHYDKVIDHYEERSRQVGEQVLDHYETKTSRTNNGDGTFTEHSYEVPVYRTEYHTEYYDEPVYRDEPVYATMYYYDIDEWVVARDVSAAGTALDEVVWPDYELASDEREGQKDESYKIILEDKKGKEYTYTASYDEYMDVKVGDQYKSTYKGSTITKLK